MGFTCPYCKQDFKQDRQEFLKHIETEHDGIAKNVYDMVVTIAEDKEDE